MSLKASEVYKFKTNKKSIFISQSPKNSGRIFWHSKRMGTYIRGIAEGKTFLKKLKLFNRA